MSQYKAGTVAVTNGSAAVVGTGTLWLANAAVGQTFMINGSAVPYVIGAVPGNGSITLTAPYAGATQSGLGYEINTSRTPTLAIDYPERGDIDTATTLKRAMLEIEALLVAAPMGWTPRLSKSVAGNTDVTLTAVEAGNLFLEFTGVLTGNINVIVPAAARLFGVANLTTGAFTLTVKTPSGTGLPLAQNGRALLEADGTNVINPLSYIAGALAVVGNTSVTGTITSGAQKSSMWIDTLAGIGATSHGSVDTGVVRFTRALVSSGADFTHATSATLGSTITINRAGLYSINANFRDGGGGNLLAITRNSTTRTAAPSPSDGQNLAAAVLATGAGSVRQSIALSCVAWLAVNDVIRLQQVGNTDTDNTTLNFMRIDAIL